MPRLEPNLVPPPLSPLPHAPPSHRASITTLEYVAFSWHSLGRYKRYLPLTLATLPVPIVPGTIITVEDTSQDLELKLEVICPSHHAAHYIAGSPTAFFHNPPAGGSASCVALA